MPTSTSHLAKIIFRAMEHPDREAIRYWANVPRRGDLVAIDPFPYELGPVIGVVDRVRWMDDGAQTYVVVEVR